MHPSRYVRPDSIAETNPHQVSKPKMQRSKIGALRRYLDIYTSAGPFEELETLFDPSLRFRGPMFSSDGAKEYIAELERDPPVGVDYTLLSSFESDEEAILVVEFSKPAKKTKMMVWGKFSGNRIRDLTLVFDPGALR